MFENWLRWNVVYGAAPVSMLWIACVQFAELSWLITVYEKKMDIKKCEEHTAMACQALA